MILGMEIVLLLVGIGALLTGRLPLSPYHVVRGAPARLLGLLALMPVPLSVCAGAVTVVLMTPRPEKDLKDPSVRATVVALEAGVVVTCAALVYGLGWLVAGAGGLSATRPDPQADAIRSCLPTPSAAKRDADDWVC